MAFAEPASDCSTTLIASDKEKSDNCPNIYPSPKPKV